MKILEINKFFYYKGGSEAYFFSVRDILKKKGHTVIDFSMNSEKNEASKYQPFFVHPVYFDYDRGFFDRVHKASHLLYSTQAELKLEALIKKYGRPDVAHLHNFYYQLSPSILRVLKRHNIPTVWTLHDYKVISPNYNLFTRGKIDESTKPDRYFSCVKNRCVKNSLTKSFLAALEMFLHKKVTKLYNEVDIHIAPSRFMAEKCEEYGVPSEKIRQLYNFIDLSEYQPNYSNNGDFLFVGRFIEEKGVMPMLEAFAAMPEANLRVIGAGPLADQMSDFVEQRQASNIQILGPVYPPKVFDQIREARALIMPSIWYENNPIIMLQAMALGKPIIGADIGGIPELIDEKQTGLTYEYDNIESLKQAVRSFADMDAEQMGRMARRKVEQIADKEKHYEKLMEILEEAIELHQKATKKTKK